MADGSMLDRLTSWIGARLPGWMQPRALTPGRVAASFTVAVVVDGLQLLLGPAGWSFADEILDVGAMLATSALLGFHPLLLPTFVIEVIPIADVLPTWTGCVALVVASRRSLPNDDAPPARREAAQAPGAPAPARPAPASPEAAPARQAAEPARPAATPEARPAEPAPAVIGSRALAVGVALSLALLVLFVLLFWRQLEQSSRHANETRPVAGRS